MQAETFVLIVGGGPVGLSAAIDLNWRGVPAMLVSQNLATTTHPKCNSTNSRTLEHFRRLGLAHLLRSEGLPPTVARASAYVTRFCGDELGSLPRPHADWPTPEPPAIISQMALERTLRRVAEAQPAAQIHYGWELLGFSASPTGIIADIRNVQSGETGRIKARYLLGADGAGSTIRKQLGFRMIGEDGSAPRAFMGGTMLSYFIRAPGLLEASGRIPTHMTWIINPQMRAMMYLQDGVERWVVHYQVPPGVAWQDVSMEGVIRDMLGTDLPFEILSGGPWTGGLALVADHYQQGPVFLAGDAAHLFTPLGGLGMNTGVGDVMNLCWKLSASHAGWAGPALLDSYELERRPIGVRNSRLGVQCARVMDAWHVPADLEEPGPEGARARKRLGDQIVREDAPQYLTVGLQLGERYAASPIVCDDGAVKPADTWDRYEPSAVSGGRAPHVWLEENRCLYDEFGPDFTLLDFGAPDQATALADAARRRGLPLKVVTHEQALGPYQTRLVLVRPDHHIAWQGNGTDHPEVIIDHVRGMGAGTP